MYNLWGWLCFDRQDRWERIPHKHMDSRNVIVGMRNQTEHIPRVLCLLNESLCIYCTNCPLSICIKRESRIICTLCKNYLYYIINTYFSMSGWEVHCIIWRFPCFSWYVWKNIFCTIWGFCCIVYSGTGLQGHTMPCSQILYQKMQAAWPSSMLVSINKTTHHDKPEDCHLKYTFDCRLLMLL
jgi:hypothetical protein